MFGLIFYIIAHFIIGLIAVILGLLVFSKNKSKTINKIFGLFSLSVAVWSFSYGIWLLSKNPVVALFWSRTLNLGATFIPVFYFHWIISLLEQKRRKTLFFYYFVTVVFVFFSYSHFYISGTKSILQFPFWPQAGVGYLIFLVFVWLSAIIYGMILLIKELKEARGLYKEQIRYVLLGSVIGFIGGSTNFPLMLGVDLFPPLGSPLVVAYPIFFSYAMVKHRLMDIRFVLRSSSVYIFSLISLFIPISIIKIYFYIFSPNISQVVDLVILVVALLVFPSLKDYYYRLANKYFFSSLYDGSQVISSLSDKFSSVLDSEKIYGVISDSLINSLRIKSVAIFTYEAKPGKYVLRYNKNFDFIDKKNIISSEAYDLLLQRNRPIIIEELESLEYEKYKTVIDSLSAFGIEVVIPLNIKDKGVGLIVLGQKESKDMYNNEDLEIFKVIGTQTAIALENALLYEEQKEFNIKLKKEVEKATTNLRAANKQLKKLDEAKSEFISIASHQLRTPLTAIKGYISMMLEGDFGKLTVAEKDSLEKVFASNERLIKLVENLLNISRIESGRLQFNYEDVSMEKMVDSIVYELTPNAKNKGLKLIYKKPKVATPIVKIDEEKIRQVVMNMTDNAIKYTKQGTVTVELEYCPPAEVKNRPVEAINTGTPGNYENGFIEYCVTDSGMGISPNDLPNLFQKFSRGTGTSLIHTEGTGLGLYVARQMIETHRGQIWAESKGEGLGSKFCFRLPVK